MSIKNKVDFSVLMTVYNKENPNFLDASLNSIEDQTIKPTEIVVIKDGPLTKELDDVLTHHSDTSVVKYVIYGFKKNMGRGPASRKGVELCSTNWIARMDSDDISLNTRFEKQVEAIRDNPDVSVVGGLIEEFVDDPTKIMGRRNVPTSSSEINRFAKYRNPINNPSVMLKKEDLLSVGNYSDLNILEDYDLWIRFISKGYKLINLEQVLVKMRVGYGLFDRRGGLHFLLTYVKMKRQWRKLGVGTLSSEAISDFIMMINTLVPNKTRKFIYKKMIHKK
ncbi:glycosyltransferase [Limosilactobacillus ingluviei]